MAEATNGHETFVDRTKRLARECKKRLNIGRLLQISGRLPFERMFRRAIRDRTPTSAVSGVIGSLTRPVAFATSSRARSVRIRHASISN